MKVYTDFHFVFKIWLICLQTQCSHDLISAMSETAIKTLMCNKNSFENVFVFP